MKKIAAFLAIAFIAVYGVGHFNLGANGALRFASKMESLINQGAVSELRRRFPA
ncbi:MAG: hypothetical protein ABI769_00460 [Pseudomonadota bacterium]